MRQIHVKPPPPGPLSTPEPPAYWGEGPPSGKRCLAQKPGFGRCTKRKHRGPEHLASGMEFDLPLPEVCPVCRGAEIKRVRANAGARHQSCMFATYPCCTRKVGITTAGVVHRHDRHDRHDRSDKEPREPCEASRRPLGDLLLGRRR